VSGRQSKSNSADRIAVGTPDNVSEPWPVTPKRLLTPREQRLYDALHTLYPDHRLFIQVALSQLVDVARNHPNRYSIRNRFDKLVADFVLCQADLQLVAVIELDDASHRRADRQAADARKTKALADAGLRLIRIPEGPLPSNDWLRDTIDGPYASSYNRQTTGPLGLEAEQDFVAEDRTASDQPIASPETAMPRLVRRALFRVALGAILIGGWVVYINLIPHVLQRSLMPLAVKPAMTGPSVVGPQKPPLPTSGVLIQQDHPIVAPAAVQRPDTNDPVRLQNEKIRQWKGYYLAPESCDHPVDWNAQVECGNKYMRAKRTFEEQWAKAHAASETSDVMVLDNSSAKSQRR
jgi:Protein of unknown function (DUF2726)